jgi:hypothetical protein
MKSAHRAAAEKGDFRRVFSSFWPAMKIARKIKEKAWKLLDSPENREHNARWWSSESARSSEWPSPLGSLGRW